MVQAICKELLGKEIAECTTAELYFALLELTKKAA